MLYNLKFKIKVMNKGKYRNALCTKIRSMDSFSQYFHMQLDEEEPELRTELGGCCTLILAIVILIYSLGELESLLLRKDNILT